MSSVSDLYLLQELDSALDRATTRLEEIERLLEETEELILARQVKEEKELAVNELRSRQKDLEWEVDEVRTKVEGVDAKLYGGSVRIPKELSDLDADLRSLKALLAHREDGLLALMVEIDEADADRRAATEAYTAMEAARSAACEELLEERSSVQPEADSLRQRRMERIDSLDRSSLSLYTLLRERKSGLAVARVEQGMCQGCRISLPAAIVQRAKSGAGPVQCVSCERILFVS